MNIPVAIVRSKIGFVFLVFFFARTSRISQRGHALKLSNLCDVFQAFLKGVTSGQHTYVNPARLSSNDFKAWNRPSTEEPRNSKYHYTDCDELPWTVYSLTRSRYEMICLSWMWMSQNPKHNNETDPIFRLWSLAIVLGSGHPQWNPISIISTLGFTWVF